MPEIDVARPPERRQAEAHRADAKAGIAEAAQGDAHRADRVERHTWAIVDDGAHHPGPSERGVISWTTRPSPTPTSTGRSSRTTACACSSTATRRATRRTRTTIQTA